MIGATVRKDGYLEGNGWRVSWCVGHLAGLADADSYDPKYAKWRYDDLPILPEHWQMVVGKDKKKQFDILKKLMNAPDVTEVVNACDAGREGEMIFRSVYELAGCKKPMKRLWISSMEDSAIREGFANLRSGADYDGLRDAALCRAKADWLVGINATRLFSVLYHRTLNIGRVMSPTLALIVQREAEIDTFQPVPFYTVALELPGLTISGERMADKAAAEQLKETCQGANVTIKKVECSAHYAENRLDTEAAVKDVLEKFGAERVQFILVNTIQHKNHDGRISQDNKAWAKTIPMPEDSGASRHCAYLVVDQVNPGLTDLFTRQFRKVAQEQQKSSVLQKLKQELPAHKSAAPKKREPER